MNADRTSGQIEGPTPKATGRIHESAGTIDEALPSSRVVYRARYHAGQRLPFHAIPALARYLLLVVLATAAATYAIREIWWTRTEFVSTHGLLPSHRLNKPVTATAIELGSAGRERVLVADQSNLFVGTPIKSLRYWQWFPLERLSPSLVGSTIRSLSASDGKVAIVPENGARRGLLLGALPGIGSWPTIWDRPVIDTSYFPGLSDKTARAALYDRMSGDWLIGALNVAPYAAATRQWKPRLLPASSKDGGPQINDLAALGDGIFAGLGAQGIDTLRWFNGSWSLVSHLGRSGGAGPLAAAPRVAHFSPIAGQPAGTGELTFLTEAHGLGEVHLVGGRGSVEDRIGEGRANGISRKALARAIAGTNRESAWMLYRAGATDDALSVALYRFKTHQMFGLPAGQSIPVGADAIVAQDPHAPQTAWIGGHGLFAASARADQTLEAVNAQLTGARVEEITPAPDAIFAVTKPESAPTAPAAVVAAPRNLALSGRGNAWLPFIGSHRLDSPITLNDITAATDGRFNGHDSLILGTRKDGIIVFDRANRELRPLIDAASAAVVAPGSLDLHARGRSIVQVASDHSVNFYDGNSWRHLIPASGVDLVPGRIRTAVSSMGASAVVLSDGQSNAVYDARKHEWYSLPRLELSRMVAALNSLWAVTPAGVLYRLPFSDPQWRPIDGAERVLDLHAQPDMLAVLAQRGTSIRVWIMRGDATRPKVVFESNESVGDPSEWRTFAVREKQLFVAPHNAAIGHYDGETHRWSSIGLPPGANAPRELVATDRGLWFVDVRGLASFRSHEGNDWTTLEDQIRMLRLGTDGHTVTIQTADGRVLVGNDGPNTLRTIVGAALTVAPDKIATGVFFKGDLIVASDSGVHRYDAERHAWENAARADPIVEFADSAEALYARTRTGMVLRWNSKDIAGWQPVGSASGTPIRADRLAGSAGAYVALASRESGVAVLSTSEPTDAKPLVLGSRLQAAGTVSAAAEIGQELVIGTTAGAVSSYGKTGYGPRGWTNDLTNPVQTGAVRRMLVPPGRGDRLVVLGTPQAQTGRLSILERQGIGRPWSVSQPVLRNMSVADAAVDASAVFAMDARTDAPVPLARVDLGTRQEKAIVGAAFPSEGGARAPTKAVGISPRNPSVVWRADQAGQVAGYNLIQHHWQPTSEISDVDYFFNVGGKLWSWSRARGTLAENDGNTWRPDSSWREVAHDSDRIVLIGRNGNVVVRDGRGERTIVNAAAQLPLSSPADILTMGEHGERLFVQTKRGALISYEANTHRWQTVDELSDVQQFASTEDRKTLFARTAEGALWRLDQGSARWSRVRLPDGQDPGGQVVIDFRRDKGRLLAIDKDNEAVELAPDLKRLGARLDDEEAPAPLYSWQLGRNASGNLLRSLPDGSLVDVSLTSEGFGFDRIWAVACASGGIQLFTDDGLVRIAGDGSYDALPNLDRRFMRPQGETGTAGVVEVGQAGQVETWLRAEKEIWRHNGQAWEKDSAQNLQHALERARPAFWNDDTMSWSRTDVVALKVSGERVELRFQASSGRFEADQPNAIAADPSGIVVLTADGVVRYGNDFAWQHISWPPTRAPIDVGKARLVTSQTEVFLEIDDDLFRWSDQRWSKIDRADVAVSADSSGYLLDGDFWRVSRRQSSSEVDIGMRMARDNPFVRVSIANGRFDFETVRDVAVVSGALWIATQFGIVEIDPATREIRTLHKTDMPVSRLAGLEGALAAELDGGSTLIYRDARWQPGDARHLFAEADRRVVQGGPWQWLRSPTGLQVQLNSAPSGKLWAVNKPLEVRFSGNRFAFDDVRDAAFAERPWLATAAGLVGRSGADWTHIDAAVPGQLSQGSGWDSVLVIGTPETDRTLFARIDGRIVMLVNGDWRPASDAIVDRSLIREHGVRNPDYEITRAGSRVRVGIKFANDPPGHYMPAEFDRTLRRFRHDMPRLITRDPAESRSGLLIATRGGVLAVDPDRNMVTRLYADPASDGIGTEDIKALVHLAATKQSLALLANGRIARLDAGATRWSAGGAQDSALLDAARRVPQDDPNGWRIEIEENQPVRLAWRGQPAILVAEASAAGQANHSTRFAHDVAQSAFIDAEGRSVVIGTRGGIVSVPVSNSGRTASSEFVLRATDVVTAADMAQRSGPRGIGFLRPGPNGTDIYATREADGQALRLSATEVQDIAQADPILAASEIVAKDAAWIWSKASSAPVQMTPSKIFRVSAGYSFLKERTWSFLDIDRTNRRFPHRTMAAFMGDLFVATAGGVSRFATSSAQPGDSRRSFITAVYAEARGRRGKQPMIDVVELYVTGRGQLMARTKSDESFAFDPTHDEWSAVAADASPMAELFRVADTPLLDWRFDESGQPSIVVRPLLEDLKEEGQSTSPLFSNGRFAFDDVQAVLHVGDELWLATAGGICIYDRRDFTPRRFVARAFMEGLGAALNPRVRELVRDPDRPDRIVARMDSGIIFEASRKADFRRTADPPTDGLDVFERAYTRKAPDSASEIRIIQYPFGSYRFPQGALRARFRDSAGNWLELGDSAGEGGLPLFSKERFAFDDVRDAILYSGQLFLATPVGIVRDRLDWGGRRVTMLSIDTGQARNMRGQLPALHDMEGLVRMPSGAVMGWNNEQVFRLAVEGGRTVWRKERDQANSPVRQEQVLSDSAGEWRISLGADGAATITHVVAGREMGKVHLDIRFSDVSRPISDPQWIYLPNSGAGLIQIEKSGIH